MDDPLAEHAVLDREGERLPEHAAAEALPSMARHRRNQLDWTREVLHELVEVVGNDDKHVGTVDKVAGDRIILTKSDQDSGGTHHSLSCSEIERVEGDKVMLDCSAEEAKHRWRDESRDRALFEREDQGEMGPRNLNRSFEGTYR